MHPCEVTPTLNGQVSMTPTDVPVSLSHTQTHTRAFSPLRFPFSPLDGAKSTKPQSLSRLCNNMCNNIGNSSIIS